MLPSYHYIENRWLWVINTPCASSSGLYRVDAVPEGDSVSVSGFTPGTTADVTVDYTASCCTTQVDIIGVDGVGNVGKCHIDLGILGGKVGTRRRGHVSTKKLDWTLKTARLKIRKIGL